MFHICPQEIAAFWSALPFIPTLYHYACMATRGWWCAQLCKKKKCCPSEIKLTEADFHEGLCVPEHQVEKPNG